MKFEEHCAESKMIFGAPFEEVHRWLDEFAGQPGIGMRHRRKRHHQAGIEYIRRLYGDLAAEAARRHIISDLMMEGWTENNPFPIDELDYIKMGLY